ncbi:MAG: YgaP family membrane protein [Cellulomonas sp.]
MKKNLGSVDRKLRAFALAPALVVVGLLVGPAGWLALVAYALAAVMVATSLASTCPIYSALGLSTGPAPTTSESRPERSSAR